MPPVCGELFYFLGSECNGRDAGMGIGWPRDADDDAKRGPYSTAESDARPYAQTLSCEFAVSGGHRGAHGVGNWRHLLLLLPMGRPAALASASAGCHYHGGAATGAD